MSYNLTRILNQNDMNNNEILNIICLNEFNFELWAKELGCHVPDKKIYSGKIFDSPSSGLLEPWSQWPSFYYGIAPSQLGIKELGQGPKNKSFKPLWDEDKNSTNLIIGMMNATTQDSRRNLLIPDPWTVDLKSMPKNFQKLGKSIKNLSTNYLNLSLLEKISAFISVLKLLRYVGLISFIKIIAFGVYWCFKTKFKNVVFIGLYELLVLKIAITLKTKKKFDRTILFFNIFAHIQHHYWKFDNSTPSVEILFGKEVFKKIIRELRSNDFFKQKYIIHNALNQENCINKEDWVLYRPLSHKLLFKKLLESSNFETHEAMTNDGYLSFKSNEDADEAILKLNNWFLGGEKLFQLTKKGQHLFYRPASFKSVSNDATISNKIIGKELLFFDFFKFITRRTGRHIDSFNFITNLDFTFNTNITNARLGQIVFRGK